MSSYARSGTPSTLQHDYENFPIAITTKDELPKLAGAPSASLHARPTPSIPSGGLFSPFSAVHINATPRAVFDAIIDAGSWKQWNSFVPSATVKPPSGSARNADTSKLCLNASLTFKANMNYGTSAVSKELVTVVDAPPPATHFTAGTVTRICWVLDNRAIMTPRFLMAAERVNEIEDHGDGTCTYRTWETFSGPVARIVKWKYEAVLRERFKDWAKDLKGYVERKEALMQQREGAVEMPA